MPGRNATVRERGDRAGKLDQLLAARPPRSFTLAFPPGSSAQPYEEKYLENAHNAEITTTVVTITAT